MRDGFRRLKIAGRLEVTTGSKFQLLHELRMRGERAVRKVKVARRQQEDARGHDYVYDRIILFGQLQEERSNIIIEAQPFQVIHQQVL